MQKGEQLDGRVRKLAVCVAKIPKAVYFFFIQAILYTSYTIMQPAN